MSQKSILEQALLQINTLEEAVKQNAKGILASTMKQELNDLLKESMEEEDGEETKVSDDEGTMEEQPNPEEEEGKDMSDEEEASSEEEEEADDETDDDTDLDNEPEKDIDSLDSDDSDDSSDFEDMDNDSTMSGEEESSDDDVMDMTGASDEEVMKVFKAMKPEDGIVVKKDGSNVELTTGDDEYIIKLDEEEGEVSEEEWHEEEMYPSEKEEETIYEIELDEDEDEDHKEETTEEALKGLNKTVKKEPKEQALPGLKAKKVEATEAARTKSNPHGNKGEANRAGLPSKKKYKAGSGVFGINEEVEKLRKQNSEYKKALVLFKDKLNEVAVFNANLAYATRLFTEHSTTKQEKLNILKRFDSVSTMNESKNLFSTIKTELDTKKPVTESVIEKISNNTPSTSSQEMLSEAKAYENPQFTRMKDLMRKIK
jgi:hypothetical protein